MSNQKYMTGRISFGPLYHTTLGYDNIFRELEKTLESPTINNYPPHNIIKIDDNKYIVELACAGYTKEEIEISVEDNILYIKGDKMDIEHKEYIHKGISSKKFTKTIRIVDTVEVQGAEYVDGILRIGLENIIPDHKKPRKVEINTNQIFNKNVTKQLLNE
jgi:molecular chaperone IbpA